MEMLLTVTQKGQVTLPKAARELLGVGDGKEKRRIALVIEKEGIVQLKAPRYPDIASLRGAAGKLPRALDWEETLQIARENHLRRKSAQK